MRLIYIKLSAIASAFLIAAVIAAEAGGVTSAVQELPAEALNEANLMVTVHEKGDIEISAHEVPLGVILRAVCEKTGLVIKFPPNAAMLISGHMGPGSVEEVINTILKRTGLNYIIQGSDKPDSPLQVSFFSKGTGSMTASGLVPASAGLEAIAQVWQPTEEDNADEANNDPVQAIRNRARMVQARRQFIHQIIDQRLQQRQVQSQ